MTSHVQVFCILCSVLSLGHCGYYDSKKLQDLTERFFQWRIKESPEYGTKLGIHDLDEAVQEYSEAAFKREMEQSEKFLNESKELDYESLGDQERISLEVMRNNIITFREGYELRKYGMYNLITPMDRPTSEWEEFPGQMRFETEHDYRVYLNRLSKFPQQMGQKINLMRRAISNGITAHSDSLTGALDDLNNKFILSDVNNSFFYEPFLRFPSSFSSQLRLNLTNSASHVILQVISPAALDLRHFIEREYGPVTRPQISVSSLPGGDSYYRACLKWHTTLDWSPEKIHEKGLEEVGRIMSLIEELKNEAGFVGGLRDYINYLNNQSGNFYYTEKELQDGYEQIITDIHDKLDRVLYKIPKQKLIIQKSTNPQQRTARYRSPPLDGSRPGQFVAKLDDPKTKPKYRMPSIALHEGEPGHHTQFSYTIDENLPTFRRAIEYRNYNAVPFNWPFYTGYVEGWALYAETLGDHLDAYTDSKALFGKYESELFRASRLVVDTGIHAFNWTKEKAVEYLYSHTAMTHDDCVNEVNRYISWPGQSCAYKIGELKIKELRNKAETELADKFDLRKFHHQVLKLGPAPLSVLESRIIVWIAAGHSTRNICTGAIVYLLPVVSLLVAGHGMRTSVGSFY